eukprot:SAG31_NODE_15146_length_768_cov_0.825112_1_plen_179_part_10
MRPPPRRLLLPLLLLVLGAAPPRPAQANEEANCPRSEPNISFWRPGPAGGTYCPAGPPHDATAGRVDSDCDTCADYRSQETVLSTFNSSQSMYGWCCPAALADCPSHPFEDGTWPTTLDDGSPCCDLSQYATDGHTAREQCCATCGWIDVCDPRTHVLAADSNTLQFRNWSVFESPPDP